jgi:DNA methylase
MLDRSFSDRPLTDTEEPLVPISAASLLDTLTTLRTAPTVVALRVQVAELQAEIRSCSTNTSVATVSDSVGMTASYLLEELEQIATALTLERSLYYVERLVKSITEERTSAINDINLNRWKEYDEIITDSFWRIERRDGSGVHSAGYWGNFVPQIPYQMMRRYTRKGDWVLDTFAGSGTTLVEGQRLGRNTIGIELQPHMVEHARNLVAAERKPNDVVIDVVHGDSTKVDYPALLADYGQSKVHLALMHPPYFDIIRFSEDPRDLSNSDTIDSFLDQIGQIVDGISQVLERGRYLVLVIGDKYAKGDWIPLGFSTMNVVLQRGYALKSIVVKNFEETSGKRTQKELWRYRALVGGFYVFKHEYVFVFRKG